MGRVNGAAIRRQTPRADWPPEAVAPPSLYPVWAGLCFEAFGDLGTCRDYAWGVGPIPWTAIHAWGTARGLSGPTLRAFTTIVRRMDAAWLPLEAERIKRAMADEERKRGAP